MNEEGTGNYWKLATTKKTCFVSADPGHGTPWSSAQCRCYPTIPAVAPASRTDPERSIPDDPQKATPNGRKPFRKPAKLGVSFCFLSKPAKKGYPQQTNTPLSRPSKDDEFRAMIKHPARFAEVRNARCARCARNMGEQSQGGWLSGDHGTASKNMMGALKR